MRTVRALKGHQWAETHNNVFGRTVNPLNTSLTSGGSSGGEAALIAMKGSVLGVGSDIGGHAFPFIMPWPSAYLQHNRSIRVPSHFCGVYGFKPSSRRVPAYGTVATLDGQEGVPNSFGPISSSLSGITTFMRSILGEQPWRLDPGVIHKPWNEDDYALSESDGGRQLCFGLMWDEGTVRPHPPVRRALEETKRALERAGHKGRKTAVYWSDDGLTDPQSSNGRPSRTLISWLMQYVPVSCIRMGSCAELPSFSDRCSSLMVEQTTTRH